MFLKCCKITAFSAHNQRSSMKNVNNFSLLLIIVRIIIFFSYRKSHFTKTVLNRQNTIIAHNASPVSTGIQPTRLDSNPTGIKMAAATM